MFSNSYLNIQTVKHYSSVASLTNNCSIRTIQMVEDYCFFNELAPIKGVLDAKRIDYSATKEYDNNQSYVVGETCTYAGFVKVCIKDSLGISPNNIEHWENAKMFSKECLNNIWCRAIAPYISHMVVFVDQPLIRDSAFSGGSGKTQVYFGKPMLEFAEKQAYKPVEMAYENLRNTLNNNDCLGLKIESKSSCNSDNKTNNNSEEEFEENSSFETPY